MTFFKSKISIFFGIGILAFLIGTTILINPDLVVTNGVRGDSSKLEGFFLWLLDP